MSTKVQKKPKTKKLPLLASSSPSPDGSPLPPLQVKQVLPCTLISTTVGNEAGSVFEEKLGSNQTTLVTLIKRAKARELTYTYVDKLLLLDSPLHYSYETTLYCSSKLTQLDDKITSTYCNQRWCMVCNRIRVGKCIRGYVPELSLFKEPKFLTLTVPNVPGEQLRETIRNMVFAWRAIYLQLKERKYKLAGVRKLECTYNYPKDNYHPHLHFVLEGQDIGELIIEAWLAYFPEANRKGQKIKDVTDKGALLELFKYFTKIVTRPKRQEEGQLEAGWPEEEEELPWRPGEVPNDAESYAELNYQLFGRRPAVGKIYIPALDTIFCAMRGHRVFQGFGIRKQVEEEIKNLEAQTINGELAINVYSETIVGMREEMEQEAAEAKIEYFERMFNETNYYWSQREADWIHIDTGVALTGNRPATWISDYMKDAVF